VRESRGIEARYRRVATAWANHVEACQTHILYAASKCSQKRVAVVIGAGLIHDLPLDTLAKIFERVKLVDVCFPPRTRRISRRLCNVELVECDVTQTVEALYKLPRPELPLEVPQPTLFQDEEIDLTVSLNVLSQLPCMPLDFLRAWGYPKAWLQAYAAGVIQNHLAWLSQLPGEKLLITDTERIKLNLLNQEVERIDLLFGNVTPPVYATWTWQLAPCPEADPKHHFYRKVIVAHAARVQA
jgi:hypothetical protein